jgi:hypothetical protein
MEAAESSYNAATSSAAVNGNGNGNGTADDSLPKRKMRITCKLPPLRYWKVKLIDAR